MIKANELRIGNFVNVPREDQSPFRIDVFEYLSNTFIKVAMTHPEFGDKMHPLTWYGEDLKPIPLTEEWLVELGFENWDKTRWQIVGKISIASWGEGYLYFSGPLHVNIFYVHQLQNLYHALTGEELVRKCELTTDETPIK